ncbi:hypothetical protein HYH02_009393 [Chlamydomonas schloesseri]|uniref:Protein kinase domain-containing protein n=1 Tax=Chlamydomonas schloesseri TaxID=2026947 RepID=A0A835TGH8_9CHLO|nr:hypothetical protein HYH02_009393 [Chlamydomonas schloesseri]|eukprot:KAG2443327.1 hypothetical protein HYH02_009393 [Chlamydomonas schloesseri]
MAPKDGKDGFLSTLLSKLSKKKKPKADKAAAAEPATAPDPPKAAIATQALATAATAPVKDAGVIVKADLGVAGLKLAGQVSQPESDGHAPNDNSSAALPVAHEKLLAALESQNPADVTNNSNTGGGSGPRAGAFNAADLAGVLFAQRTNTQTSNTGGGLGMVLPARMADAMSSAVNSAEAAQQRQQALLEDATRGSYIPSTVGPMLSHAQNTQDSNTVNSNTANLQDMLYGDYDALDRSQGRPSAPPGSAGMMRSLRPPLGQSLLGMPGPGVSGGPHAQTTPQLQGLPDVNQQQQEQQQQGEGHPVHPNTGPAIVHGGHVPSNAAVAALAAAATGAAAEAQVQTRSAPLVKVPPEQQIQHLQQVLEAQQALAPSATQTSQHGGTADVGQGQRSSDPNTRPLLPVAAASAGLPNLPAATELQAVTPAAPQPPHVVPGAPVAANGGAHASPLVAVEPVDVNSPPKGKPPAAEGPPAASIARPQAAGTVPPQQSQSQQQPHPHPQQVAASAKEQPAAAAGADAGSATPAPAAAAPQSTTAVAANTAPRLAATAAAAPRGANASPGTLAALGPLPPIHAAVAAPPPPAPVAALPNPLAPAPLPSYQQPMHTPSGLHGDQPVPLSRPMKLTTACLGAHTTLCDSAADQSFQKAMQRKMQMVFKWLNASDLNAAPDPRLEIPLPAQPEAGGGGGADATGVQGTAVAGAAAPDRASAAGALGHIPTDGPVALTEAAVAAHTAGGGKPGVPPHHPYHTPVQLQQLATASAGPQQQQPQLPPPQLHHQPHPSHPQQQHTSALGPGAPQLPQVPPPGHRHPADPHHHAALQEGAAVAAAVAAAAAAATGAAHLSVSAPAAAGHVLSSGHPPPPQQQQQQQQVHHHLRTQDHQQGGYAAAGAPHPAAPPAQAGASDYGGLSGGAERGQHRSMPPSSSHNVIRMPGGANDTSPGVVAATGAAGGLPDAMLQHSLSDLYVSGHAGLGTNMPQRVLQGSDDAFAAGPGAAAAAAAAAAAGAAGAAAAAAAGVSGGVVPALLAGGAAAAAGGVVAGGSAENSYKGSGGGQQGGVISGSRDGLVSGGGMRHSSGHMPPARTKTIAVASHCPAELQPSPPSASWTIDDFHLLKKLYEGSLSVVCQAQHRRSGRHVALKIYKRSRLHEMERFQLAREICLHIRIVHPYVVALYAAWKDSKYVYLALEWAPQGNMFDFLVSRGGRLGEEEAARVVMKPLMSALAFLHSQSFLHRDVKLENLLLDASCNLKLADFGLAIDQKFEQANTRLGTFGYFAPEVLDCPLKKGPFDLKDTSVPGYDSRVDVWSAGVVGYEVLTGRAPFSASSPAKIIQAIRTRVLEFPGVSEDGKDFLRQALTRDPALRPTAKQMLGHPWILRHCGGAAAAAAAAMNPAVPQPLLPLPAPQGPDVLASGASAPRHTGTGGGVVASGSAGAGAGTGQATGVNGVSPQGAEVDATDGAVRQ